MITEEISKKWTSKDLEKLPLGALQVLDIFVKHNKNFMDSDEIQKWLEIQGKSMGARMAIFSKYEKDPLIFPALKVSRTITRWAINKKYLPLIKKRLKEIAPYLK